MKRQAKATISTQMGHEAFAETFLRLSDSSPPFHFIGVGGIGMSAVARGFLDAGYSVSGSDLQESSLTRSLLESGCRVAIGHCTQNVSQAGCVVVSTAIDEANPEVLEARRRGIPILHRSEALQILLEGRRTIAVTGTHGKTTTSAMTGHVLHSSGFDPLVALGGELSTIGGNFRTGSGTWAVVEADESDRSFLNFRPDIAVVTNIELEHVDHYGNVEEVCAAFHSFLERIKPGGLCLLGWDCPQVRSLDRSSEIQTLTYGLSPEADIRLEHYRVAGKRSRFTVLHGERALGECRLRIPGRFNAQNALAALGVATHLGLSFDSVVSALESFPGVRRRFEMKGHVLGITVLDDYAHHPREIEAALSALEERYRGRRVGVFQPHRYSRTRAFAREFAEALKNLHVLVVTGIYSASEEPIEGISGQSILKHIRQSGMEVHYVENIEDVADYLVRNILCPGDVLITLGAGSVTRVGDAVLARLRDKEEVPL